MSVPSKSIVGLVATRCSRWRTGIRWNQRATKVPIAFSTAVTAVSSKRRAAAANVVDAGASGTARNTDPARSARNVSRSDMKSPSASIDSAIDKIT
jgi:hypothetical protein